MVSGPRLTALDGRCAVITGAASGIGFGIAAACGRHGMNVVMSDIEEEALHIAAERVSLVASGVTEVVCDVASLPSVTALATAAREAYGPIHILCNNAGVAQARRGADASHEDWRWLLGVNLWGVIHGIEAFLPGMLSSGEPCQIVNTSSVAGVVPHPTRAMYSTAKYGVAGLSESLRLELADTNVGVSAFCPAGVTSRIHDAARNRPAEFGSPVDPPRPPGTPWVVSPHITPEECGELVIEGILRDRAFIFTDPLVRPLLEERHAAMVGELDRIEERLIEATSSLRAI
jgi:NAD(P)-dependent dehydrogenase (short-subunit alcohol dehydrogenase family)